MKDFSLKLDKLPQAVKDFLTSIISADLNILITKKYSIADDKLPKYLDLVSGLFFKEIKLSNLVNQAREDFSLADDQAKKLAMDIAGIRLLPVADWLGEDINGYIKALGGNPLDYAHYLDEQKKALMDEAKYFAEQNAPEEEYVFLPPPTLPEPEKEIDPVKEKEDSAHLFEGDILSVLTLEDQEFIDEYNYILIKLMYEDDSFRKELEKLLYVNQEVITSHPFFLGEKQERGTIANWLKDFISQNGSEMFNVVALSRFLTTSANAKVLDEAEKKMVRKVLKLYRNLVFFPDSLANMPQEEWQIFPIEKDVTPVSSAIRETMPEPEVPAPSVVEEKTLDVVQPAAPAIVAEAPTSPEPIVAPAAAKSVVKEPMAEAPIVSPIVKTKPEPVAEPISDLMKIKMSDDLFSLLSKYPANSLEARAIKEEIKKRQKPI